jgi:dolichol kinase
MGLRREEITRKLLHVIFGAVIPAGILYIPLYAEKSTWLPHTIRPEWYPAVILAISLVLFTGTDILRLKVKFISDIFHRWFGAMLRHEETKRVTGATWIIASSLICSIVFVKAPHISAMVLGLFIWGDAAAALVGQSIGRIKIGHKSLEGSIACFVLCIGTFFFIFPHVPLLLDSWSGAVPVLLIFIVSLSITIMELMQFRIGKHLTINDNLIVPIIAGFIMQVLYPLM